MYIVVTVLGLLSTVSGQTVRLCCPRGTVYKENPDYDEKDWLENDFSDEFGPRTCQESEQELVSQIQGIGLQGGDKKFSCPDDGILELVDLPETNVTLLPSGDLQGIPVLITIYTLIMDNIEKGDLITPIMGQYTCFIGKDNVH